jgi:very-short-patch-repair endonuclease
MIPPRRGGWRAKRDGWGPRLPRTTVRSSIPNQLRKQLTPQEAKLWNWLREGFRPLGYHFRRQVPVDTYVVDFACLKHDLIVEADGGGHGTEIGRARDARRDAVLTALGFRVLRFWNHEIDRDKEMVMDTILAALEKRL